MLLILAIEIYFNHSDASFFLQADFDVDIGSAAVFEAEFRLPQSGVFIMIVFIVRLLGLSIA